MQSPWNNALGAKVLSWLAAAVVLAALILAAQVVVGGPFTRRLTVKLAPAPEIGAGVYQGKVPAAVPMLDWNAPLVRVSVEGVPFVSCKGNDQLLSAAVAASRVKGRTVWVRRPDSSALPATCVVRTAWLPTVGGATACAALLLVLGGLVCWWRPPLVGRLARVPVAGWLLGATLGTAVFLRLFGFAFPSWENDSDDYFRPIFQWLSGQPIGPTDRPLGYPLVAALALRICHDFRALTWLQKAASLAAGGAMAHVLFASARRLFPPGAMRFLARLAGAICVALFLFNERVLQREWFLLPEPMSALWIAAQLWLGWRVLTRGASRARELVEYGLFCAAGWAVFFTKSNWGFALALLPLPLLVRAAWRSASRRELLWRCAEGAAVLAGVTALAVLFQKATPANTLASVEIRSRVLVCWHAPLVRLEIARRLAEQPPDPETTLLAEVGDVIDTELALARAHGPGAYPSLGYDADRLYYFGFQKAAAYATLASEERAAFCRRLFVSALRRHPALYLAKVRAQMALYFHNPYAPATIQIPHVLSSLQRSERWLAQPPPYLPEAPRASYRPVLAQARAELQGPWPSPARAALALRVDALIEPLNRCFAWALGGPMLLLLTAAAWRPWRAAVPWRRLAPVLGLAGWATGSAILCALSSSVLQALEIQRYIDLFISLTLLSEVLWPLIAVALLLKLVRRRATVS